MLLQIKQKIDCWIKEREEFKIEVKDTTASEAGIKQTINGEAGKPIYARDMITELTEPSGTVEIQFKDHTYEQDSSSENENIDGVDCNMIAVCYEDEGEKNSESNSENGGTSNNSADSETSGENAGDSRWKF